MLPHFKGLKKKKNGIAQANKNRKTQTSGGHKCNALNKICTPYYSVIITYAQIKLKPTSSE